MSTILGRLTTAMRRYRYWHGPRVDGVTAMAAGEFSTFAGPRR